jgi:VanZ family protein
MSVKLYFRAAGWVGLTFVVVASLVPYGIPARSGAPGAYEHFFAYFATSSLLLVGYDGLASRMRCLFLLFGCAALLEVAQVWIPGRTAELLAVLGSCFGAVSGNGFACLICRWVMPSGISAKSAQP